MKLSDSRPTSPSAPAKKPLHKTPKKQSVCPPSDELVSKTPEKSNPKPRLRNRKFALSIGDVPTEAQKLQKSNLNRSDLLKKSDLSAEDSQCKVSDKLQKYDAEKQKKKLEKSMKLPEKSSSPELI